MIVALDGVDDDRLIDGIEIGFAGEIASQPADGVFDAAFLPWRPHVAEEGLNIDLGCEFIMEGKLRTIVESDGAPHGGRQGRQHIYQMACGAVGFSILRPMDDGEPGGPFMGDQDGLAPLGKKHEIGFPMA